MIVIYSVMFFGLCAVGYLAISLYQKEKSIDHAFATSTYKWKIYNLEKRIVAQQECSMAQYQNQLWMIMGKSEHSLSHMVWDGAKNMIYRATNIV